MGQFKTAETIKTVIGWMRDNQLLIPAFQRDYVWKSEQVLNLFDSIMRGYPISSMLFWKVTGEAKSEYQYYEFLRYYIEMYHTHNEPLVGCSYKDSFLAVLDGQQRLTSLYLGLCGTYAYHMRYQPWENIEKSFPKRKLYINLSKTNGANELNDQDEERVYNLRFLTSKESNDFANIFTLNDYKWFLVGHVLEISSLTSFIRQYGLTEQEAEILEKLKEQICVNHLINYYEEDTVVADQAVNIFIRINAGGTYLSISDILMSILRASWKRDARADIQKLIDKISTCGFYINNDYIIKALLYLKSNNIKNLIQNFNQSFLIATEKEWDEIAKCIECLFDLLRGFGLNHSMLLSYNATLPILYYMYSKNNYEQIVSAKRYEKDRFKIKTWLFKTLLLKTFGGQSDGMLSNARKVLKDYQKTALFPSNIVSKALYQPSVIAPEEIDKLLDSQKDDRQTYLILSLLFPDYVDISVDKDHLHPISSYEEYVKLVKERALEYWQFNSVVNLQLLTSSENKSKSDEPLNVWVKNYSKQCKYDLYSHAYIPRDINLSLNNFNQFYVERRKLLSERLSKLLSLGRIAEDIKSI